MKKLLLVLILAGSGYYYYDTSMNGGYDLSESATVPVPQKYFFSLWDEVALKTCEEAPVHYNTDQARCEKDIQRNSESCRAKLASSFPELIEGYENSKIYGRKYLNCITPYAYCNDIEVTNMQEAKEHCK